MTIKKAVIGLAVVLAAAVGLQTLRADDVVRRVEEVTKKVTPQVIEWRRDFHMNPELSNREVRTGRTVAERLREIGVDEIKTGVANNGVVALIRGGKPGPAVALRADMDALPIEEDTGLPFASKNKGVMHACGHDSHTAMLLGAAKVLVQMREQIPGTIKLIFQPAEEGCPEGEEGGARLMVKEGVLENPKVSAIFGLHVHPDLPTGKIEYRFGGLMASVDRLKITVTGKQSHAAMPWQGVDPIVASAHIITAIQTIASRKIDARQPVVVSIGIIRAGTAWNIIPQEVVMEGTIRTHSQEVRDRAAEEFKRIVTQTAAANGAKADVQFHAYGPVTWNDPKLGEKNVLEAQPVMGGEDFAHFAKIVPGFYCFLGTGNESIGAVHGLHNPKFVFDEAGLPIGVRAHCLMALDYLRREAGK